MNQLTLYRVFDHKGNYQQSYTHGFKNSVDWAIDCAIRVKGRVERVAVDEAEEKTETIFTFKAK